MDVPSRKEFEELRSKSDGLYRFLGLECTCCWSHREFSAKIKKAIDNCDAVASYTCEECGAEYSEIDPVVIKKI